MGNINDIDDRHGNNVFKKFKLKNRGEYHDSYVQSDKVTHYYLQMYSKTLEICALKCMSLILLISYHYQD